MVYCVCHLAELHKSNVNGDKTKCESIKARRAYGVKQVAFRSLRSTAVECTESFYSRFIMSSVISREIAISMNWDTHTEHISQNNLDIQITKPYDMIQTDK